MIEREGLLGRVLELEGTLAAAVNPLADLPEVSEVRAGLGLLAAVEIDPQLRAADPAFVDRLVQSCRVRGVLTRALAGRALQISPPYVIEQHQLQRIADTISDALAELRAASAAPSGSQAWRWVWPWCSRLSMCVACSNLRIAEPTRSGPSKIKNGTAKVMVSGTSAEAATAQLK